MGTTPDYKRIYIDMINMKYRDRMKDCENILNKNNISSMDVIALQERIFGKNIELRDKENGKFRAYGDDDICKILSYQKKNRMNNTEISNYFKVSRNSISKWKKKFPESGFQ